MRLVIQRVSQASVTINGTAKSSIGLGLMILAGFEPTDNTEDIDWVVRKTLNMRIFNDENEIMNHSILDVNGEILVVSQFTLHASTNKGNRPSYMRAAKPTIAIPLYEQYLLSLEQGLGKPVGSGEFGAMMNVSLVNSGPVTIIIDSKNRE